ncbi:Na/Pi cotransporter family protein [Seleniivibrio sp.]|uniref:Na/Pi cotransporter family protein n=1 Tax=Seleniivibrio sp. TaxID=2898801 RepID=UPI0025FE908A|nr:Na/Pi cotransporter family protein [Seleniivibrio sp.]MCD8553049.1 Na/Pi cotransporter family protein [Seleniivibrio sp.]
MFDSLWVEILFGTMGGLGMFLFGMKLMSEGLQKSAGEGLKSIIEKFTSNRFIGTLVGTAVTVVIQSSSATTVMVVGFVNAGLMNLMQALSVVFGANIGTTITAQMIAFKVTALAMPCIGIGVVLAMFSSNSKLKYYGEIMLGFGLLFFGMETMTKSFVPLREMQGFVDMFVFFGKNPIIACIAGAVLTMIVQSSSATVGITIALASTGILDFTAAAALVMGENIGTTITANIAAIGANRTAKQAALGHFLFNFIGVCYMLILLPFLVHFVDAVTPGAVDFIAADGSKPNIARHIANIHTTFNIINTIVFLPFLPLIAKLCERIIKPEDNTLTKMLRLDANMLKTPSIAVAQAKKEVVNMSKISLEMLSLARESYNAKSSKLTDIKIMEFKLDQYEKEFNEFLSQLSRQNISASTAKTIDELTHVIQNLEKLGDNADNIARFTDKLIRKEMEFSDEADREIKYMFDVVERFAVATIAHYGTDEDIKEIDLNDEELVDSLRKKFKNNHMHRLNEGKCNINSGLIFVDIVNNLEKAADHVYNIAQVMVFSKEKGLKTS